MLDIDDFDTSVINDNLGNQSGSQLSVNKESAISESFLEKVSTP